MKIKHILLTVSLIEFAIGFSNARQNTFFYVGLPFGAVCLALSLIFQLLEKESALYDKQNRDSGVIRRFPNDHKQGQMSAREERGQNPPPVAARSV